MLPPYVNSPCHKVADAGNSASSFSISAILHSCMLGYSCFLSAKYLDYFLTSINYFCWIVLVCIYRYAFRHILGFLPSLSVFNVINMVHDQHVFTHGMCLPFCFYALPRASCGYIWCGFIPSAVWRFSNIFFQLFRCRNLALNRVFSHF